MKFIHLSDLHLGKRVNEFSMLEDQKYILTEIINIIDDEQPDGVIIAGDVYDKSVPSAEAVSLFDDFLCKLSEHGLQTFIISGNHDSPERIAFGSRLMSSSGIHISPVYDGNITPVSMNDIYGTVHIYMLPFIKPVHVRSIFPEEPAESYTEALNTAISHMDINETERNILVTHQFVTGAARSDSEEISVGGSDNVDPDVFSKFDYTALGHIHRPQNVGGENIRYSGTPLKYSFSEAGHRKSVTVVELAEKGSLTVREIPLIPRHDMREIKGTYMELTAKSFYERTATDDYIHVTLTDEEDIPDAVSKLRVIYPNLMKLDYDNRRTRNTTQIDFSEAIEQKSPIELFSEFYEMQNGQLMNSEQSEFIEELIKKIWNGEK
ncbi:MAG: exonuclease SbcCD subunit D [Oscillospiraceae bacterium]|nr:exonuclease SbcCD subunit D [Oscillospiraceae bacterium]